MAANNKLAWINDHPRSPTRQLSTTDQAQQTYRPRREHSKSRNGCENCRQRRIKCDEAKPKCGQCLHRRVHCEFQAKLSEQPDRSTAFPPPDGVQPRLSTITQILLYLEETGVPCAEFKNPIYKRGDARELLDHFVGTKIPWLGSPQYQKIIQKEGLQLAMKAPYLLHAILAISASHLSLLRPSEKKYSIAAALHYQYALACYSSQLHMPVDDENADSVIGCGFVQTMLAFENISRLSLDQSVCDSGSVIAATWLRAMQGVRILLGTNHIHPYLGRSIWLPVFLESGGWEEVTCQHIEEVDGSWASVASKELHSLCDVSLNHITDGNPYRQPLENLCGLMRSDITHETIGRFMVFVGKLPDDFLKLFEQNDVRAMLLMAYWCALISSIHQWWIVSTANYECRRLCAILDSTLVSRVRDLLRFPAGRCGYVLRV